MPDKRANLPDSIDDTLALLSDCKYVARRPFATAVLLALRMDQPLFLEGGAGLGESMARLRK